MNGNNAYKMILEQPKTKQKMDKPIEHNFQKPIFTLLASCKKASNRLFNNCIMRLRSDYEAL